MSTTMLIGIGGVAIATTASATVPVVSGVVKCDDTTGKQSIDWTVNGDSKYPNETATVVTQSLETNPTLVGQEAKAGVKSAKGTQADVNPGEYTQKVKVQWTNHKKGDLVSAQGSVTVQDNCSVPDAKDASADVEVIPATCEADGSAKVKDLNFATLVGELDTSPGDHTQKFKSEKGHRFENGKPTKSVDYTVPAKKTGAECAPSAPTAKVYIGQCTPNQKRPVTVEITASKTREGNTLVRVLDKDGNVVDSANLETFNGEKTATFNLGDLPEGEYTYKADYTTIYIEGFEPIELDSIVVAKCDKPGDVIKPKSPTFDDFCGVKDDTYTVPAKKGVVYKVNGVVTPAGTYKGVGMVKITAEPANENDSLKGKTKWEFSFTDEACPVEQDDYYVSFGSCTYDDGSGVPNGGAYVYGENPADGEAGTTRSLKVEFLSNIDEALEARDVNVVDGDFFEEFFGGYAAGEYRVRITDTATGKVVYDEPVVVDVCAVEPPQTGVIKKSLYDEDKTCKGLSSRKGSVSVSYSVDPYTGKTTYGEPVVTWGKWTKVRDLTKAELVAEKCTTGDKQGPKVQTDGSENGLNPLIPIGGSIVGLGLVGYSLRRRSLVG